MPEIKYPLAISSWDDKELEAIQKVIDSNRFTMGPHVKEFEKQFAEFFGSRYAVMVNSGSSANLLAIAILVTRKENPLKRGDQVIVPAVSWSTTYAPLQQYGLKLKFVDVDIHTLNYDLNKLEEAIDDQTKLIVAVNLLGNPNDYGRIQQLVGGRDITLVEDNCESMGAQLNGKYAGTFGDIGTFSCFFSHHISTMEGGFIVTDDEEYYHLALAIRAHGWTRDLPKENQVGPLSSNPFEESFHFLVPGYNLRPLELSGAIGIEQLKKLPHFVEERRKNAAHFQSRFSDHEHFFIQKPIGDPSWFGFSMIVKPDAPLQRSDVIDCLTEAGIECRPIVAGNFTRHPAIQFYDYEISGTLEAADQVHTQGFFIGNGHEPIISQIDMLSDVIQSKTLS